MCANAEVQFTPIVCEMSKIRIVFNTIEAPEFDDCPLLKESGMYSHTEFQQLVDWLISTHGSKNWFKTCKPLPEIDPSMGGIVYLRELCEWFEYTFNDVCDIIPIEGTGSDSDGSTYLEELYSPISTRTSPDCFEYVSNIDWEPNNVSEYFNLNRYEPFKELI